ncbi:Predicted helicase [Granulicella rosea]|uniref:Predicted helicase n=1 Tax=Granulicella rosea TaxID=474952 RepID=A0A239HG17_9BACT|nr:type ISP restriction/modification enzyme [Granulicella rosea]SNS80091.1 Predicted helicase [Granulicella rosea]
MTTLQAILDEYRTAAASEREKGTYFEELILCYLKNEATYKDLYSQVWTYADWANEMGLDRRDTGIDLVAKTRGTGEFHAIQCKLYAEDYCLNRSDLDSFFTASGKKTFSHRLIVSTTNLWTEHAEDALNNQHPAVSKIDLHDLENSQIDWSRYKPQADAPLKPKKVLREHQVHAVTNTLLGLSSAERGKLIMACGTGKTFTSLKIAEAKAGKGGRVLFLVPSLSLLSQTLTEWTQESEIPLHSFAVCSDSDVGKKRKKDDDSVQTFTHELRYPATTDASRLATEMLKRHDDEHMSVVFSTYHSLAVVSAAQHHHELPPFDLVVCDEAHRTTGATFDNEDESTFVRVHDKDFLAADKRLYMTATPRIYGDLAKATAERDSIALCSMDDESLYGTELHVITFSEAVKRGLLVDYKVIVLSIEESHVSRRLQGLLADEHNQLKVDDAAKIVGCWKALSKQGLTTDLATDDVAMKRAVAFCQVIEIAKGSKIHKVSSKNIASMFQEVVEAYQDSEGLTPEKRLACEAAHVDGSMNASEKEAKLDWLKADAPGNTCRVLSNVRCLSEGVDVPALDAVLFLTPRNSQVDVVQSVGRVMRNAPGKQRGYVILPVVIPAGVEPHDALSDNKTYAVVWQVLQALRSHDDRFDAMVNKLDLIGQDTKKMEVIAITDKIDRKPAQTGDKSKSVSSKNSFGIGIVPELTDGPKQEPLQFEIGEIERAIYAKIVQKCGNRNHWEDWANDIAKIARTHIGRITDIVQTEANEEERAAFDAFAKDLRDDLNDSITDAEIIEMLAQHLISKPVFDALFTDHSFAEHNPMSQAMQHILDLLQKHRLDKETDTLQKFYDSVRVRAEGISSAAGRQKIVVELYDRFFRNAFPEMAKRLGIVYTPVEIVDFIIHSVNRVLQTEFSQNLGSEGVHIIDPFTGTGTFITRMLQSGLIDPEQMQKKYRREIHANEIVLLAYYIAAVNIEGVYHSLMGGKYETFEGICLADTFQLYEKEDLISQMLVDNSARRKRQKKLDIRVIVGNPPYSSGDKDDDNNKSVNYPSLDERIAETYVARSSKRVGKSKMYDSYIRAIRWASDRVGKSGVIGYVTNAGWLEANTTDGLRKSLGDEFSTIYIFHLRGNQRTIGEKSRQEGGKIFGSGSRAPIAISIFVKNPASAHRGRILWHDIGDYLNREEKLAKIAAFGDIEGIELQNGWVNVNPNEHGDWFSQRSGDFSEFFRLGDKQKDEEPNLFSTYSMGIKTNRDDWVYSFSKKTLEKRIVEMTNFYNSEVARFQDSMADGQDSDFVINRDKTKIKWTSDVIADLEHGRTHEVHDTDFVQALYRPFTKQWIYSNKTWNWSRHLMPSFFPNSEAKNRVISLTGLGSTKGFTALMVDTLPDLEVVSKGQCFPQYVYESQRTTEELTDADQDRLFAPVNAGLAAKRHGITDEGLRHFQSAYPSESISKDDLFFYVYGVLHSVDYREKFADNLSKEIPRIPRVKSTEDFWRFCNAGRELADLHLNYDSVAMYPLVIESHGPIKDSDFAVQKMRVGKVDGEKDLSTLHYNERIVLKGIPTGAYGYIVNGKSALEWVIERQGISLDPITEIRNDANAWAKETVKNPRYPLELFQRVITVSLETQRIVAGLPSLDL